MVNSLFVVGKLEHLLKAHWTEFLDHVRLMRVLMEQIRDTEFKVIRQQEIPTKQVKVSITNIQIVNKNELELWAEYTIPKGEGVVIGTTIIILSLSGEFQLREPFGTHFLPQKP
jgi:hypothetical protein